MLGRSNWLPKIQNSCRIRICIKPCCACCRRTRTSTSLLCPSWSAGYDLVLALFLWHLSFFSVSLYSCRQVFDNLNCLQFLKHEKNGSRHSIYTVTVSVVGCTRLVCTALDACCGFSANITGSRWCQVPTHCAGLAGPRKVSIIIYYLRQENKSKWRR